MPHLSWNEVKDRAIRFSRDWKGTTSERSEKQSFWNAFFEVFGLRRASVASFEENVRNLKGNVSSIDLLWKGKLLVEHKSFGEDLALAATQAFTYIEALTREDRWEEIPRFVLVSDFARFTLYDLEPEDQLDLPLFAGRQIEHHTFTLAEFPRHVRHFAFMLGQTRVRYKAEDEANEKAYARMCQLHDELARGGFTGHALERLLVRVLFCLFAEDNGIFAPEAFTSFIRSHTRPDGSDLGPQLTHLFQVLDKSPEERPQGLDEDLAAFPYVNGELFRVRLDIPVFDRKMRDSLLYCCDFQWARISPAVFGSLFQGIMEDRERRQKGAHYTSERDILKVIRSLFLDELRTEWERVKADRSTRRRAGLEAFQAKLRSLQFLDPACGCGNFLVLAYRELRALEIEVVAELHVGTFGTGERHALQTFRTEDFTALFGVNVDQFHGIEKEEWPVRIAEVALWLMDNQMNQSAATILGEPVSRLPLRATPHIVHANALRLDWNDVLPAARCSHVLGNPPFIGHHLQDAGQKADQDFVLGAIQGNGVLDYVCNWYVKAAAYIQGTRIPVAFVSTNSITQGEQAGLLWNHLFQRYGIQIHFAHRTFAWESEARGKAHVHVVIVGFGQFDVPNKRMFDYDNTTGEPTVSAVTNISPYLFEGPDVVLVNRSKPICDVPGMRYGNKPTDGGHFLFTPAERDAFLREEPAAAPYIRPYIGADEFLEGRLRYCLWLKDVAPSELRALPKVRERVAAVRDFRLASVAATTREYANYPTLFRQIAQPNSDFILIPGHTSENRKYIPFAYLTPETIVSNACFMMPDATPYHFGILTSAMHMAWVRQFCGRLESRYRYSKDIVYNNFPWPASATPAQRAAVKEAAREVIAAREPHLPPQGMSTLADLYDPLSMPVELAKAHARLDRAVEKCYRPEPFRSDRERVEHLFRLYETLTTPLLPATSRPRTRRPRAAADAPAPPRGRTPGLPAAQPSPEPDPEGEGEGEEADPESAPTAATTLPEWYELALTEFDSGLTDDAIDRINDALDEFLTADRFDECDAFLRIATEAEKRAPIPVLIAIVYKSRAAAVQLPHRAALRDIVHRRVQATGKDADRVLKAV